MTVKLTTYLQTGGARAVKYILMQGINPLRQLYRTEYQRLTKEHKSNPITQVYV